VPVQSFKERERQRRESEILCAAERLIAERGYAELTMDDLADTVGISKPTLYQHFKSKDDLLTRVMLQSFGVLEAQLRQPLTGTPVERLRAILRSLLEQRYAPGGLLASLGPELVLSALRSSAELVAHKTRIVAHLCALVDDAKAAHQIDSAIPTPTIVRAMFCLLGVLPNQPDAMPEFDGAIDAVIRLFFHGIILHKERS
jgi:AcrR family transcriptional regulator